MDEKYKNLRISRSYVLIALYFVFFLSSLYGLIQTIQARGEAVYVFLLGLSTIIFFFLTLICFFSPYIRVDDDRIIIHHDMLRKDILFFYDLNSMDWEEKAITVFHLHGQTRIEFYKMNPGDKTKLIAFFKALEAEKSEPKPVSK